MKVKVTVHVAENNEIDGLCNEQGSLGFLKNKNGKFKLFNVELDQFDAFNRKELKAKLKKNKLIFYKEEPKKEEKENENESETTIVNLQGNQTEEGSI